MNENIAVLEPAGVWKNFVKLNEVPRPSKKEERVIAFMMEFGRSLNLETIKDSIGNVIIRKPATAGMEDRPMVTLQSHLDMVHQKNADTSFDFDKEGIRMKVAGEWVKAEGTTLGADNGMGVAAIMALLESTDIPHPPLEALFTIDEETGMTGAKGLEKGTLEGEILLNLDTEEDDEIDIGCAGGVDITAQRDYMEEELTDDHEIYQLVVRGLQGGHSGMDIDKGLGNANKIMNRLLAGLTENLEIRINSIHGGGLRNAIPRESKAIIAVPAVKTDQLESRLELISSEITAELTLTEPGLKMESSKVPGPVLVMDRESQEKLLKMISAAHNGVYTMSAAFDGLVESSNNIARITLSEGKLEIGCLTRSSVESVKMVLADSLKSVFELGGCEVSFSGEYPGWTPDPESKILKVLEERYTALFEEQPRVVACHAGLECGIIGNTFPELDMISFGPTIRGAHSPDERVHIGSVKKFWTFLLDILRHIPKK
ncbi:aminoacyl-histidine dipeptidase [Zeaxanthinibacter sp. PT1]|uniref:aminoacyl-histidine dipeptidase n=1 Tax=Zeaxanthinibacter TaxID=561554 RepID=UPI0023497810|nr:aminoacyl-histidine dipeptidase [Zeaxanthinibacter sp. PT1]MDC6352159.1 aminoacyl-histidine dipeptidase [Zeaxanthinibacter sp. PT1]